MVEILLADIERQPIITNSAQEILLGIHLKAVSRLERELRAQPGREASNDPISNTLVEAYAQLADWCLGTGHSLPSLKAWSMELISARRNIHDLKRSRIRRFLRTIESKEEDSVTRRQAAQKIAELLAALPTEVLQQMAEATLEWSSVDTAASLQAWNQGRSPKELRKQVRKRADRARSTLVQGYLRYVVRLARNSIGQGVDYEDLVQAGFEGLMRAAGKFDYTLQARFGTYATSWIWQSIGRTISEQCRPIRVPVHRAEAISKLRRACQRATGTSNPLRDPMVLTSADLLGEADAEELCRTSESGAEARPEVSLRFQRAVRDAGRLVLQDWLCVPIDAVQDDHSADDDCAAWLDLSDRLMDETALEVEARVEEKLLSPLMISMMRELLSDREAEVLSYRYGLEDGQDRTLEEVGEIYGLTRERIRQIEARAFKKLQRDHELGRWPFRYQEFLSDTPRWTFNRSLSAPIDVDKWIFENDSPLQSWDWLDQLIEGLPRGDWHFGTRDPHLSTRREQLETALLAINSPAHFSDIIEQANAQMAAENEISEAYGYSRLVADSEIFIPLGEGVFSLVKWERARAQDTNPVLRVCPQALPDPPDYDSAFFESVYVAQHKLQEHPAASHFLASMLVWAQANQDSPPWYRQSILSAYYLVGLIPYVFCYAGDDPRLVSTLPQRDVPSMRQYCMETLTNRLVAMPEFWWQLRTRQPLRSTEIREAFSDIHPDGLDDALQRLHLLTSLGALQRLNYGYYRLTPFGETCAERLGQAPNLSTEADAVEYSAPLVDDLLDLSAWYVTPW